jgi:hypothetical protein
MHTATKVGGFILAVAVVFAGAYGVGRAVGPVGTAAPTSQPTMVHTGGGN